MSNQPKKSLGFWMLTALVAGNMIGSGVFMLPASLAKFGTISIFSWCLTATGSIVLALIFARLSQMIPKVGGPYAYCHEAFGDFIGFQIAYNYWIALWVGNAAIAVAFVGYLSVFFPQIGHTPALSLTTSILLVWILTLVNIRGVRTAGIVQLVTTLLKLFPLVLVAIVGLFFIKKANLEVFNVSGHSDWHALTSAATLTLWAFVGLESGTVPADDVVDPKRTIPRATIVGVSLAAVVYIFSTVSIMGALPLHVLSNSSSPFALMGEMIMGHWGSLLMAIAAVIACLGTLNGWTLLQAQVPLAAAKDGLFPQAFAKRNKRGTPVFGLVVSSALITGLLILRYGASLVDEFTFIILLAVLATLIPYLYTSVAEVLLYFKYPEKFNGKRLSVSIVLATLGFVYTFWAMIGAGQEVVFYGFLLFISGVPVYLWMRARGKSREATS